MSEYTHLIGAEDVRSAGHRIQSAADQMSQAAARIDESLSMALARLEEILSLTVARAEGVACPRPTTALHIIFDGPPSHESGRFVEVETPDGKGVSVGEWRERPDGLWALVIPAIRAKPDGTGAIE